MPGLSPLSPWLRRIALLLGGLLLLAALAIGWLVATFDAERYKALAVDWMRTEYQRSLVIDGPVELSVLPRLAVTVRKVSLSERGRDDRFLSADEAALTVRLLPLLRQRLVVDRVRALGVRGVYQRGADGRRNIDDLIAPAASTQGDSPSAPPGSRLDFDVSGIELDDLTLQWRDALAPLDADITIRTLKVGRLAPRTPTPVSFDAAVRLRKPQSAALTLKGQMRLTLDPDHPAVSTTDLKLSAQGDAAGVKGLELSVEGALGWDGQAFNAGPLRVQVAQASRGPLALSPSSLSLTQATYNAARQQLVLKAMKLALAGQQGQQAFEMALDWPELSVQGDQLSGSTVSGTVRLKGASEGQASFQSKPPAGTFDALRLPALTLKLAGRAGERQIDGEASADLGLRLDRLQATLESLDLRARVVDPGLAPLQLQLSGQAGASADAAQWALQGTVNSNRFDSRGKADLSTRVPRIEASAKFDTLDLNRLLAPATAQPAPGAVAPEASAVSLDALNAIDGRLSVEAGSLIYRQHRVDGAKVNAELEKGVLTLSRLYGRAWGGTIEASGSARAPSQRLALRLDANNVDVDALLKGVAGKDLLEGRGRVSADLQTQGATVGALRSALAGTAALQLRDGAVKGLNLARVMRQAKAAISLKADAVSQAVTTEKTDFSTLSASARIKDGVAVSDDLDLKSPFLRIGGNGRFDVGRGVIDYTARATVVADATGQDSPELKALRGVTVPVRLTGPFDAIDWKVQWSGVATEALTNRLKDKLSDELGRRLGTAPATAASAPSKPKDVLKDAIKGLFR